MSDDPRVRRQEADRLYEQHGREFEPDHWGEFVAITPDGRTVLAPTLAEALMAAGRLGPGSVVYRVGSRAAATLR